MEEVLLSIASDMFGYVISRHREKDKSQPFSK